VFVCVCVVGCVFILCMVLLANRSSCKKVCKVYVYVCVCLCVWWWGWWGVLNLSYFAASLSSQQPPRCASVVAFAAMCSRRGKHCIVATQRKRCFWFV